MPANSLYSICRARAEVGRRGGRGAPGGHVADQRALPEDRPTERRHDHIGQSGQQQGRGLYRGTDGQGAWLDRQGADQLQPWLDELQGLCREAGALQRGLAAGGVPGDQRPGKVGPAMQGRGRVPVQFRDLEDAEGVHQREGVDEVGRDHHDEAVAGPQFHQFVIVAGVGKYAADESDDRKLGVGRGDVRRIVDAGTDRAGEAIGKSLVAADRAVQQDDPGDGPDEATTIGEHGGAGDLGVGDRTRVLVVGQAHGAEQQRALCRAGGECQREDEGAPGAAGGCEGSHEILAVRCAGGSLVVTA